MAVPGGNPVKTQAMQQIQTRIRCIAADLLDKGRVDGVMGYRQASLPYMTEPFMARTPGEAASLVFNSHCRMNLAAYLAPDRFSKGATGRVAVVAKGCDSRSLAVQIRENRLSRAQVYIIGVPCTGIADRSKLLAAAGGRIEGISESGDTMTIARSGGEAFVSRTEVLQSCCTTCSMRNPVIYNALAGKPVVELDLEEERFSDDAMPPADKAAFLEDLVSGCIRCGTCTEVCPLCDGPSCSLDGDRPHWGNSPVNPMTYHLTRASLLAGRCIDCGACEAACFMNIPIRRFTRSAVWDEEVSTIQCV